MIGYMGATYEVQCLIQSNPNMLTGESGDQTSDPPISEPIVPAPEPQPPLLHDYLCVMIKISCIIALPFKTQLFINDQWFFP